MTADADLAALAEAAGLAVTWRDNAGVERRVDAATLRAVLAAMGLPADSATAIAEARAALARRAATLPPVLTLTVGPDGAAVPGGRVEEPFRLTFADGAVCEGRLVAGWAGEARLPAIAVPGWHRLEVAGREVALAAAPPACPLPADPRAWGLAVQVYALRRPGDRGAGDHGALAALGAAAARAGAAALAISPQHALFAADPHRYSPYAPSSRRFLNPLHADPALVFAAAPEAVADGPPDPPAGADPAGAGRPAGEAEGELIDWPAVSARSLALFRALFARHRNDPRFAAFRAAGGAALERHAVFEALHARQVAAGGGHDWRRWPAGLRDPASAEVAAFARAAAEEVAFHAFLQFLAAASLAATQRRLRAAGMAIGLIADLAVGADPAGADAWARPDEILAGLSIGAPPDAFSPLGQDWGLSAFSPTALIDTGFAGFLEVLRAALAHAGGVRIDHVMGLERLWLVPPGASPAEGVYLRYPREDLLRLVVLEAWQRGAIVIGEDLGTVPAGLRERLAAAGILGMRVLWFERDWQGAFTDPAGWTRQAVAMTTTHDLPTVAGWWQGRDIAWRRRLGRFTDAAQAAAAEAERARDRAALWQAFCRSGAAAGDPPPAAADAAVVEAALRHLGTAGCALALVPLEDLCALAEQPNLPGTVEGHPNWRRRLPTDADRLLADPQAAARLAAFAAARRAVTAP